ncbi:MAG: hypothetical protein IPH20_19400 [Bacteroidales bacterium]|jgi:hypothetical protein|nr:hypothetical protein [Bacteroidales bacterium]
MKTILIKGALIIPVVFFLVYLLLITISGITCAFSADAQLYCNTFCKVSRMIVGGTLLLTVGILGFNFMKQIKVDKPSV